VDGRRYFSLTEDQVLRAQVASQRTQLIQAILAAAPAEGTNTTAPTRGNTPGDK
jgi:hypothetical protein